MALLKIKNEQTLDELLNKLPFKEADILSDLRYLLSEEKIGLNNYKNYYLKK